MRPALESVLARGLTIPALVIVMVMGTMGCAAAPLKELPQAQEAIKRAKAVKAEQYASDLLRDAEASLNEAMQLGGSPRHAVQELLQRARLQADVAAALAKERAAAEQLQSAREQRNTAQAAATAAQQAAQTAKDEVGRPITLPDAPP